MSTIRRLLLSVRHDGIDGPTSIFSKKWPKKSYKLSFLLGFQGKCQKDSVPPQYSYMFFKMKVSTLFTATAAIGVVNAQVGAYGQCGGTTWSGSTVVSSSLQAFTCHSKTCVVSLY